MTDDNEKWRDKLSDHEYQICRLKGTERPFTGEYYDSEAAGRYLCKCCEKELFESISKFDAGCGWPSFSMPSAQAAITQEVDTSLGMVRTEVMCGNCGCHLGHVFDDGPLPGGLRYCINSASILLQEEGE